MLQTFSLFRQRLVKVSPWVSSMNAVYTRFPSWFSIFHANSDRPKTPKVQKAKVLLEIQSHTIQNLTVGYLPSSIHCVHFYLLNVFRKCYFWFCLLHQTCHLFFSIFTNQLPQNYSSDFFYHYLIRQISSSLFVRVFLMVVDFSLHGTLYWPKVPKTAFIDCFYPITLSSKTIQSIF